MSDIYILIYVFIYLCFILCKYDIATSKYLITESVSVLLVHCTVCYIFISKFSIIHFCFLSTTFIAAMSGGCCDLRKRWDDLVGKSEKESS